MHQHLLISELPVQQEITFLLSYMFIIFRYGNYVELCSILHKYIKQKDSVLVIGCGNSQLSSDLYDVGILNIANIDISEIVIKQMTEKHKTKAGMRWLKMDIAQVI